MKTVQDVQKEIFDEINDPKNQIHLRVQKKTLEREEYLDTIKKRCEREGLSEEETDDIIFLVDKSLWGFGIIDDLIMDPDISDIRLMDEDHVRIKKLGKRYPANVKFSSKEEYEKYIDFITSRNNTNMSVVNAAQVFTDKDSCPTDILRFSLVSDLVNTGDRPTLLIRKIPKKKRTIEKLEEYGLFTPAQYAYLKKRWQDGHGLLVCGPNGSGKTTLTNQILEETPHTKSAVIIQESEELFCSSHPEMVFRKVIPHKNGSAVSYALKDLARLALMESFDIIVVGEIKGDEAAELSYATYTGSQTMTTVHSNSAIEGYEKLIDYALDAQPNRTREHFAKQFKSLDTVVYVDHFNCKEIYELGDYDKSTQQYSFREIRFDENGQIIQDPFSYQDKVATQIKEEPKAALDNKKASVVESTAVVIEKVPIKETSSGKEEIVNEKSDKEMGNQTDEASLYQAKEVNIPKEPVHNNPNPISQNKHEKFSSNNHNKQNNQGQFNQNGQKNKQSQGNPKWNQNGNQKQGLNQNQNRNGKPDNRNDNQKQNTKPIQSASYQKPSFPKQERHVEEVITPNLNRPHHMEDKVQYTESVVGNRIQQEEQNPQNRFSFDNSYEESKKFAPAKDPIMSKPAKSQEDEEMDAMAMINSIMAFNKNASSNDSKSDENSDDME